MQLRGERAGRVRTVLRALLVMGTSAAAAVTAVALAPATSAEPMRTAKAAATQAADHEGFLTPEAKVGTRSGSGGARSGDFTGDGIGDILARDANNGTLKVYPHAGSYIGTATYQAPVTVNFGWGGIRWIGQADMNGDNLADVIYVDSSGVMRVAPHTGSFSGTSTLGAGIVIGTGWTINDLIFTYDWDGDGFDDVMARRAGTGDTYIYFNNGGINGTATLFAPQLLVRSLAGPVDVEQTMGDFTGDGVPDLLFIQDDGPGGVDDGVMGVFSFADDAVYTIGWGWETISMITVTDVNVDARPDVLGRRGDGALLSYTHNVWAPSGDTAFNMLNAPLVIGFGWNINNVIV
jgi:hypothetical protein